MLGQHPFVRQKGVGLTWSYRLQSYAGICRHALAPRAHMQWNKCPLRHSKSDSVVLDILGWIWACVALKPLPLIFLLPSWRFVYGKKPQREGCYIGSPSGTNPHHGEKPEAVSYMGGRVINFLAGSADRLHNGEEKTEAVSILHTEDRRDMDHSELCSVKV